jgi:hypothetical protein
MNMRTILVSLVVTLCVIGCSKDGGPSVKQQLVPGTVAELETSPDFKLDYTTKGGIKCYMRPVTAKVADAIPENSPDYKFLIQGQKPYLLAIAYQGEVVTLDSLDSRLRQPDGQFTEEGKEIFAYALKGVSRAMADEMKSLKREATGK